MTPRKLSDSDKQQILELYRLPGETTSTLAGRFGVSNSTISRILKTNLSEADYEVLIQQKRGARSAEVAEVDAEPEAAAEPIALEPVAQLEMPLVEPVPELDPVPEPEFSLEALPESRRIRRRSSGTSPAVPAASSVTPPPILAKDRGEPEVAPDKRDRSLVSSLETPADAIEAPGLPEGEAAAYPAEASLFKEMLREDLLNQEDLDELDDEEDDLDEDDLDEEDYEEDGEAGEATLLLGNRGSKLLVQVLPLSEATIPKICYLVIDRASELIVRPLKEFGDLGQIPEAEVLEKTLPIFDNHRVAKRYSNPRTQRVIKLPDGRLLQKTLVHLQAKGITRLLIDGQVYALHPSFEGAID
jgi:transposase-like protein